MTWTPTAPDGSLSVKANRPLLAGNTTYTKTTLGGTANDTTNSNVIRDHYWDVSSTLDGRHRFINSPAYTIAGVIADPVLGDGMDGVSYLKTKTAAEAVDNQDVQPFFRNDTDIMQMLGIRAMVVFDANAANPHVITIKYAHNATITEANLADNGSNREFTVVFTNPLPSANYFVQGFSVSAPFEQPVSVKHCTTTVDVTKSINSVTMYVSLSTAVCPLQIGVVCFGG